MENEEREETENSGSRSERPMTPEEVQAAQSFEEDIDLDSLENQLEETAQELDGSLQSDHQSVEYENPESYTSEGPPPMPREIVGNANTGRLVDRDDAIGEAIRATDAAIRNDDMFFAELQRQNEQKRNELSEYKSDVTNKELASLRVIAEQTMSSGLTPRGVNTVEKVMTILLTGRELGFTPMISLNNIHVIEGKPTVGVHLVAAMLKRAGVDWKTVKDYEPIIKKVKQADGTEKEGASDYVTTIRFYRKGSHGGIMEEDVSFSFRDAQTAGLLGKSNWKGYPKSMTWNRCLVLGARRVAPDALLGMYETSELADANNIDIPLEELS